MVRFRLMMDLAFSASAIGIALIVLGGLFLLKHFKINMALAMKSLAVLLFSVSFFRYLYKLPAVYHVQGLDSPLSPFNAETINVGQTALGIILLWFSYAAILTTVMSAFYHYKTLRRVVNLFSLPMLAVILIFFKTYGIATLGTEAYALSTPRLWVMAAEIGLAIAIIVGNNLLEGSFEYPKNIKDVGNFFYALIFAILAIMPCYALYIFLKQA